MYYSFSHLQFSPRFGDGIQARFTFPNGFACSVVRGFTTYGGRDGLYELAVLDPDGCVTYDTEITDDVLGYLTQDDVTDVMNRISQLEPKIQLEQDEIAEDLECNKQSQ